MHAGADGIVVGPLSAGDFGLAARVGPDGRTPGENGYRPYSAPETFADPPWSSRASDMWALGCVLYTLLTGFRPFGNYDNPQLEDEVRVNFVALHVHMLSCPRGSFATTAADTCAVIIFVPVGCALLDSGCELASVPLTCCRCCIAAYGVSQTPFTSDWLNTRPVNESLRLDVCGFR